MTPNEAMFTSKKAVKTSITVANGEKLHARSIGNVKFDLDGQTIIMKEVLHVPDLDANLLSISALNRKGFSVLFKKHGVEIRRRGTLVARGVLKGKMYLLHNSQVALLTTEDFSDNENFTLEEDEKVVSTLDEVETAEHIDVNQGKIIDESSKASGSLNISKNGTIKSLTNASKLALYSLWHARMGHVNPKRLRALSYHVTDIDQIDLPSLKNLDCTTCNFSNLTRIVNRGTPRRADRRLGRVHTDIWGPYRVSSIEGHAYFVSLIDDLTRKSWLICLKSRKEIYQKISEWQTAIGLQSGEKVAIYRCDNAREYQKFEKQIHAEGIRMEYATAYTPEENGVAERFNRTIIQMTRAMLVWSELPQNFWSEAAKTANYLRNLLPAGHDDLSPYELWEGSKPSVSHIRTFGCVVHVHIPSENRAKLDRVSFQGIFVGYHSNQQARIYNPSTRKIQWHTSVKFLEHVTGGNLLRNLEETPTTMLPSYNNDDSDDDVDNEVENSVNQNQETSQNDESSEGNNESVRDIELRIEEQQINNPDIIAQNPSDASKPKGRGNANVNANTKDSSTQSSKNQPTRRSTCTTKSYDKYRYDNETGRHAIDLLERKIEPSSYSEAIKCAENRLWKIAIMEQLNALIANSTWELVKRPSKDSNIITSKWVFKVKYTVSGLIDRYKARLVARGFTQVYGIDFEENFAPTLRLESLRMLMAFAAYFGFEIEQMDVPDAYLKGNLTETIYMEIPQGYEIPHNQKHEDLVLHLLRPLYGLKQSGREWNTKAKKHLKSIGFAPTTSDSCVFLNKSTHVIIALYVDDLLIFAKTMASIKAVKAQLFLEYKMKDIGKASFILGIRIRRDTEKKRLAIDQSTYIRKFLRDFGMEDCHPVSTPIDGLHALTPSDHSEIRTSQLEYQKRIGSLMYAMVGTRPDIAFAVCKLSQYCQDPSLRHRIALDRVLRYLKGTIDLALVYDHSKAGHPVCYADAAYGDDVVDRKSTYGHTLLIGNASVTWASKKQRTTASSTTEAEYIALCQASKNIIWATRWIKELNFGHVSDLPIQLFGDNQGSLDIIKNPEHHSRTKHIDIQYHYIREVVADGLVKTSYVPTREMVADILTKPTKPDIFVPLRAKLGLKEVDF